MNPSILSHKRSSPKERTRVIQNAETATVCGLPIAGKVRSRAEASRRLRNGHVKTEAVLGFAAHFDIAICGVVALPLLRHHAQQVLPRTTDHD